MESGQVQAILQSLPVPALILSQSRKVVAVNDGMCRLSGRLSQKSLIGHEIRDLGFLLISNGHAQQQDWDSLFQACANEAENATALQHNNYSCSSDETHDSRTEDFWDDEDRRLPAVVDVMITRRKSASARVPPHDLDDVRARMSIQSLRLEGVALYIIAFQRPLLRQTSSTTKTRHISPDREHTHSDNGKMQISLPEDDVGRETQVHRLVSTAIPYYTALFDSNGQAVYLSMSWYRVTGMTVEESLGRGWVRAVHPDDRESMMSGFANMIKQQEDSWTWQARYRTAGTYQWFLVRVESSKEEFGSVRYWYGSMVDVDALSRSRWASENRMKSIMALVSHTNVRLWGVKQDRSLLLQEGSLAWDPVPVLNKRAGKKDMQRFNATRPGASASIDHISDAINAILNGESTTSTLEHKEGDRWYRSTLIADPPSHVPHQRSSQAIQAVLGLTIDITDVKGRAELEVQNKALVEKERAAKEASELKSRFVANVPMILNIRFRRLY